MNNRKSQDSNLDLRSQLLELYTRLANEPLAEFGWGTGKNNARLLGYAGEWLDKIPDSVWESAAAVGNPFSLGPLRKGETVVDFGCGAGADACVAALVVGDEGKVIGIDCTPPMVDKAAKNAAACGHRNTVFHEAEMTAPPLPDSCADVVISNGAINLAADKDGVLVEAFRVLRPGGRLQIADMVRDPTSSESTPPETEESWADCVSGTLMPEDFIAAIRRAGFINVELAGFTTYRTSLNTVGALFRADKPG